MASLLKKTEKPSVGQVQEEPVLAPELESVANGEASSGAEQPHFKRPVPASTRHDKPVLAGEVTNTPIPQRDAEYTFRSREEGLLGLSEEKFSVPETGEGSDQDLPPWLTAVPPIKSHTNSKDSDMYERSYKLEVMEDCKDVFQEFPTALGLIVLFACSVAAPSRKLPPVPGVVKGVDKMIDAFRYLGYAVLRLPVNLASWKYRAAMKAVASVPFPDSYQRIFVYYSGHGEDDSIDTPDGNLKLEDITNPFSPNEAPNLELLTKIFIFDTCSNLSDLRPILPHSVLVFPAQPGYPAFANKDDCGLLTEHLANVLRKSPKSFCDLIIDVTKKIENDPRIPYSSRPLLCQTLRTHVFLLTERKEAMTPSVIIQKVWPTSIFVAISLPPSLVQFHLQHVRLLYKCEGAEQWTQVEVNAVPGEGVSISNLSHRKCYTVVAVAVYPDDEIIYSQEMQCDMPTEVEPVLHQDLNYCHVDSVEFEVWLPAKRDDYQMQWLEVVCQCEETQEPKPLEWPENDRVRISELEPGVQYTVKATAYYPNEQSVSVTKSFEIPKYDLQGISRQEERRLLNSVDEVMKKKGTLEQTILQGVFIGPPRNGKSSLMKRLLNQKLPSSSTDVVEKIIRVKFKKPSISTVNITSNATAFTWSELPYDDEVVTLLKDLSKGISEPNFSESETVPAAEELPASEPPFQIVHTLDTALEETDEDEIRGDIKKGTSSHSLTPTRSTTSTQESPEANWKSHKDLFKESLKDWSKAKQYFESECTMYLIDTAGQLEFQELLPALVSGPSVFFLVFRLDWDLNDEFKIQYSHSEKGPSKPYPSRIRLKDALLQSLASIASLGTFVYEVQQKEIQPKVFFVGTHKDKVKEERIKEIDTELQEAVERTSFYGSGLVQWASDDRILLTVNNLSDDDDDSGIKKVRKAVERIIKQDDFKVRAPPQWLIFSLVLRQAIDQPVISYAQCRSLANDCGINDSEELDKALWFLSTRVGLIRYYHNASKDLRNLIFVDPSIIFRKISKLVIETFTFENLLVRNQSVCKDFVNKGLFWLDDLVKITETCYKELLTPSRLIDLLQHLHIVARIETVGKNVKLFMPCIIVKPTSCPDSEESTLSKVPPLLVCFDCGYCPKGIFPALVAYLLNHNNEKDSEHSWILQEDEIYKSQVSFTVGLCTVSLKVALTFIKVLCTLNDPTTCYRVYMSIKQGIHWVTSDLQYARNAKWCFGFVCQCRERSDHGAVLTGKVEEHNCRLLCTINKKPFKPPTGFEVWLTKAPGSISYIPLPTSTGPGGDHPQTTSLGDGGGGSSSGGTAVYSKLQFKRDTIIRNLADLGFTGELAEKLFGAEMITRRIYDLANHVAPGVVEVDRATKLFNAVLARVELNPANYDQFISFLKQIQGSDDLVAFIEAA